MGVEYYLCDPAWGEAFDLGKGWDGDRERRPAPPPLDYASLPGYAWTPIGVGALDYARRVEACLGYLSRAFEDFQGDPDYLQLVARRLAAWLSGRAEAGLYVADDCGDDIHCEPGQCDEGCSAEARAPYGTPHFLVTGTRYVRGGRE